MLNPYMILTSGGQPPGNGRDGVEGAGDAFGDLISTTVYHGVGAIERLIRRLPSIS